MTSSSGFDVLIVGAGPAGMAAAVAATSSGKRVGVVDDNPQPGGQIWRNGRGKPSSPEAAYWFDRIRASQFTLLSQTQVLGPTEPGGLLAESNNQAVELRYDRLIIATGARELFLPFPGWTLPGVTGAGGLQALVKSGLPIEGKSVIVAGSGPLLLAVAAYLKVCHANVALIAEQAPLGKLTRFGLGLWREPSKLSQSISLAWLLKQVRFKANCWPVAAEGTQKIEAVTLTDGDKTWREPCDYLAYGFGLVPNIELPLALGCTTVRGFVGVDGSQRTTAPNIFAAGEITSIGGLDLSLVEGQIAGYAAIGDAVKARELFASRERARHFARRLDRTFAIRSELTSLPTPQTIVCRCEDITHHSLRSHTSWLDAKLQTRCGMGPCQGRICGAAAGILYGWTHASIRPPIFPAELGYLAHQDISSPGDI